MLLCTHAALPAVSEKSAHLIKLLESVKWRVMGYKGDDADGQPLAHPVSLRKLAQHCGACQAQLNCLPEACNSNIKGYPWVRVRQKDALHDS